MTKSSGDVTALSKGPMIAFGLLALIWGYNWVFMKIAMQYISPMYFALYRVGGGAVLLMLVTVVIGGPIKLKYPGRVMLLGLLQTSCYIGLISWSVAHGEASKSAVFAYSMPFWVILLSWPLLGERVKGMQWVAVILAFSGLLFIIKPWETGAGLHDNLLGLIGRTFMGRKCHCLQENPDFEYERAYFSHRVANGIRTSAAVPDCFHHAAAGHALEWHPGSGHRI